jgi:hypothetical protein
MARKKNSGLILMPAPQTQVVEKQVDPRVDQKTIVDFPSVQERVSPGSEFGLFSIAQQADEVIGWGANVKGRDKQLRKFLTTEPMLTSAVYSVSIRNASFEWTVEGSDPRKPIPKNTIAAVTRILQNSDRGNGWHNLILKTCIDLYSQDNAAFWEIIRTTNAPDAPVINIAHLDSERCVRTGNPQFPVIYTDRNGREIRLARHQVVSIEEFPSPVESMYGVQYCAVTRSLLAAQIIRDIAIYKKEKVSGQFARALHLISGVTQTMITDAMKYAKEKQANMGLLRYAQPTILSSVDPSRPLSHIQVDLATLPDAFDEEKTLKWYVTQLALAFGVDYQEFAPLPGGNLGSGSQSEILHLKTRGKGPAAIMALLEHTINDNRLIPANVQFKFKAHDLTAEKDRAEAAFTRGKDRNLRVKSGELDTKAARDLAVISGDLPQYVADEIEAREKEREASMEAKPGSVVVAPGQQQANENPDQVTGNQTEGGMQTQEEKKKRDADKDTIAEGKRRMQAWGIITPDSERPIVSDKNLAKIRKTISEQLSQS